MKNIAQNNPLLVMQYLEKVKKDNYDNFEFRSYCSHLLIEIEEDYCNKEDKSWTIIEVKKYVISQRISMQYSESEEKRAEKNINDLVSACIKLQANSIYYGASENQRNDFIRDLMETSGYDVKDQTRRGISYSGKEDDMTEDFAYSDIMIFKAVLNRNNHETELYHICVLIGK